MTSFMRSLLQESVEYSRESCLEILPLNKENMEQLEVFHRKCLRHIQSLPNRTSNSAVLLLLGALPIEAEIHKRQLELVYGVFINSFVQLYTFIRHSVNSI
jgi:hypothetical protein